MAKPQEQSHIFFKLFLPEFSSKQLELPPAFLKQSDGTFRKDAKLKDHTGKLWPVNLEASDEEILTITNGWQSFASEKSLELGDFLIFKYDDANCLFDVEIFGRSGCLKEEALFSSSNMTTTDAMNEKQKYSKKSAKRIINLGLHENSCYKSRRNIRTSIRDDDIELKAAATFVIPEGPYFVINICGWMWYVVYIPKSVLDSYGIKVKAEMVLVDHNGEKWPLKIKFRKDGRVYINHGWASFREEHKLQIGDSCVFEFILGRGNSSQEMRVQIIRSQSKAP